MKGNSTSSKSPVSDTDKYLVNNDLKIDNFRNKNY